MTEIMVAMSGGVDSSVAAALLLEAGYDVVGVTMKLWGGDSDSGCCSVSDVDDARRVANHLGIDHHVFNFGDDFDEHVVAPYVADHAAGRTPNPCIECNRHVKFDKMVRRADALGFDAIATGHHARVVDRPDGTRRLARGADADKDQSYVLYMLDQAVLARLHLPLGPMTKPEVRAEAERLGLATAHKPDSQDVCFITATGGGRSAFLTDRIPLTPGRVIDTDGNDVGQVPSVQLVTIGQRKGLGVAGGGEPRYAVSVDVPAATVTIGSKADLLCAETAVEGVTWADQPYEGDALVQISAHGTPARATLVSAGPVETDEAAKMHESAQMQEGQVQAVQVRWAESHQRVAPGQSIVFYDGDQVVGGGLAG